MKKILFFFPLLLFACISNNPKVTILNRTQVVYDSIKVYSILNIPTIFDKVEPKDVVKGKILFDDKNTSDGAYYIQLFKDGEIVQEKCFGYYTNGGSLNKAFRIIIEPDTIKVKQR